MFEGHCIDKLEVKSVNRFGDPVHFARYVLAESQCSEGEKENV